MGLDIGDRSIGIAISDENQSIAFPHENYVRVGKKKDIAHLINLILEKGIIRIVAGMPYNMNGTLGPQGEKTGQFIKALKKKIQYTDSVNKSIEIVEWDERLTSKAAERDLILTDMRREDRKKNIDMVAGTLILQGYLDYVKNGGE
jgi:putative Holliday junction resolvase